MIAKNARERLERIMDAIDEHTGLSQQAKAELQEICARLARGETFSQKERKAAAARIDKLREENARKFGVQNIAVDLVRQSRDSR